MNSITVENYYSSILMPLVQLRGRILRCPLAMTGPLLTLKCRYRRGCGDVVADGSWCDGYRRYHRAVATTRALMPWWRWGSM